MVPTWNVRRAVPRAGMCTNSLSSSLSTVATVVYAKCLLQGGNLEVSRSSHTRRSRPRANSWTNPCRRFCCSLRSWPACSASRLLVVGAGGMGGGGGGNGGGGGSGGGGGGITIGGGGGGIVIGGGGGGTGSVGGRRELDRRRWRRRRTTPSEEIHTATKDSIRKGVMDLAFGLDGLVRYQRSLPLRCHPTYGSAYGSNARKLQADPTKQ